MLKKCSPPHIVESTINTDLDGKREAEKKNIFEEFALEELVGLAVYTSADLPDPVQHIGQGRSSQLPGMSARVGMSRRNDES